MASSSTRPRWLLVVAAPAEAKSVLRGLRMDPEAYPAEWQTLRGPDLIDVVICGIGKANAAAATARALSLSLGSFGAVLSVGVAGALPGSGLELRDVVAASASVYADEGLLTPERFMDCGAMGFPMGPFEGSSIPTDSDILSVIQPLARVTGPIATVSTCSGVDSLAQQVRARTGAVAECMEGAAVAHIALRLGVASGELRVISNTTGDRAGQRWDLNGALAELEMVIGRLAVRLQAREPR
jgi:futalosine hydrolase